MITCSKCSRTFDNSVDSICPQCGNESSDSRLLQDIALSDFQMPNNFKLSGTYEDNTDRNKLTSLSIDITNSQISSYLQNSSKITIAVIILVLSMILLRIPEKLFNNSLVDVAAVICAVAAFIYIIWQSKFCHQILIEVNQNGVKLSLPKEKKAEFFRRDDISQLFYREYKVSTNSKSYKAYALCLLDTHDKAYDLLLSLPSPYLARYLEQEFEKILKIKDIPISCEPDFQRKMITSDISQTREEGEETVLQKDSDIPRTSAPLTAAESPQNNIDNMFETDNVPLFAYLEYQETSDKITLKKTSDLNKIKGEIIFTAVCDLIFTGIIAYIVASTKMNPAYAPIILTVLCICTLVTASIYCLYYLLVHKTYEIELNNIELIKYTGILPNQKKLAFKTSLHDIDKIRSFERDPQSSTAALRLFLKDGSTKNLIEQIHDPQQVEYFAYRMNKFIHK